jgi:hippurate hydrolase
MIAALSSFHFNFVHMLKEKIKTLAHEYHQDITSIRRHLHQYPELSYQEFETSRFIQQHLTAIGIPFQLMAETGVVGIIEGKNPSKKIIALRADIDALPIHEANEVAYKSQREGIMHACGHDVHTSCLLGAAKILQVLRDEWEGTIKLIFQPGEEKNPGGASIMIKEGVLENPRPQAIYALHVHPGLALGQLSFRSGMVMASADELYFTIQGKGGHAAAPHLAIDPILIGAHLITALQQIISRNKNPLYPSVLSITSFQGGNTTNVIPHEVKLMGTFRAMDENWRTEAHQLIERVSHQLVESMGGKLSLHIDKGYPVVFNDTSLTEKAILHAGDYLGAQHIEETEMRMGAEDFGYYSQQIPGCFFRLGVMNKEKGIVHGVHTPNFNIDEDAIEIGMGMMAWLVAVGGS